MHRWTQEEHGILEHTLTVRVGSALRRRLVAAARREGISTSEVIRRRLATSFENRRQARSDRAAEVA